ncbi:MAG TPA: TonB-dependent receptor [Steroidobacteraceae bacterium]
MAALFSTAAGAQTRDFSIHAGLAGDTLTEFEAQTTLSVFSDPAVVNDQLTNAVSGNLEPVKALALMLKGSGLTYVVIDETTLVVKPDLSLRSLMRGLAGHRQLRSTDEVRVLGRRPRNDLAIPPGIPVQTIGNRTGELADVGMTTVADVFSENVVNSGGPTEETHSDSGGTREEKSNDAFGVGINLHGLGAGDTLILVNGRRVAPSGLSALFTDVGSIPLSALDHIDVVADGSIPQYGADAIGGVVNFVLRGVDTSAQSASHFGVVTHGGFGETRLSQSLARQDVDGGFAVMFEYYSRDALYASQRKQVTSNFSWWHGPNLDIPYGHPGNIIDSTGAIWGIPPAQGGVGLGTDALLKSPNLYDLDADTAIVPRQRRLSTIFSYELTATDDLKVFADAMFNWRRLEDRAGQLAETLTVPASNAFYASSALYGKPGFDTAVSVLYGFGDDVGPFVIDGRVTSLQSVAGFEYRFGASWGLQLYAGQTFETQHIVVNGLVDDTALSTALGESDAIQAFNPFGAGVGNTPKSVIDSINKPGGYAEHSTYDYLSLVTKGELFDWAGPWTTTNAVDIRKQIFEAHYSSTGPTWAPPGELSRWTESIFTQLEAHLFGDATARQVGRLQASASLRWETFNPTGSYYAPQAGLAYLPTSSLTVYGNWGKWFRQPGLTDLSQTANLAAITALPDPNSPSGYSAVLVENGGNPSLRPERATAVNVGFKIAPPSWPRVSFALNYFDITVSNHVEEPDLLQTVLTDPQYSPFVYRNYTDAQREQACTNGSVIGGATACLETPIAALVDLRLRNVAAVRANGFDLYGRLKSTTSLGEFTWDLTSTYFLRYARSILPQAPMQDVLNTTHNPLRWRWRSALNWSRGPFWVSTAVYHQGSYRNTDLADLGYDSLVKQWTTVDLTLGLRLGTDVLPDVPRTRISISALNLFGASPPVVFNAAGVAYDQENGSVLGRRVGVTMQYQW